MTNRPLFKPYEFGEREKAELDRDGHFIFPGILTAEAQQLLTEALAHIQDLQPSGVEGYEPNRFAAEFDTYLESLIGHWQMLELARGVLGQDIRFDHCVVLNRPGGNSGTGWHSHDYAEDDVSLGFVRIFFYVNGFGIDDGGLKVVPGSHLLRDPKINAETDEMLQKEWVVGKQHPLTGAPLTIEALAAPAGSVALMWCHAAHGVSPRQPQSDMRWTVVYAYRNPGQISQARWLTPEFERKQIRGAEGLMSLY